MTTNQKIVRIIPDTTEAVLQRYPRLTSHLICTSLGYFTPESAARAILCYKQGKPFFCEWYIHMGGYADKGVMEANAKEIGMAFRFRHGHKGYMAEYRQARQLVEHVRSGGKGPIFASWF